MTREVNTLENINPRPQLSKTVSPASSLDILYFLKIKDGSPREENKKWKKGLQTRRGLLEAFHEERLYTIIYREILGTTLQEGDDETLLRILHPLARWKYRGYQDDFMTYYSGYQERIENGGWTRVGLRWPGGRHNFIDEIKIERDPETRQGEPSIIFIRPQRDLTNNQTRANMDGEANYIFGYLNERLKQQIFLK